MEPSILFITKDMPVVNGRTIYSNSLVDLMRSLNNNTDVEKIYLPEVKPIYKNIFRIFFFFLLLPSIWINPLARGIQIVRRIHNKTATGYSHIVFDHMQLWWLIVPLKILNRDMKIILVSHNLEYCAKISYLKYGTLIYKIASLMEIGHLYIWEVVCSKLSDTVVCINREERKFYDAYSETCLIYPVINKKEVDQIAKLSMGEKIFSTLIMVGTYDYKAKELNALWLINEVMPLVNEYDDSLILNIVGRGTTKRMVEDAANKPYVNIIGEVENLKSYYENANAAIIPEKMGGGFKLKIIEAILYRVPIVLHEESRKGTALVDGVDCMAFITAKECAEKIVKLKNTNGFSSQLVENSLKKLKTHHTMDTATKEMGKIF